MPWLRALLWAVLMGWALFGPDLTQPEPAAGRIGAIPGIWWMP